jgi:predicted  nucleic acid-binding Zn-ribbon protein
MRLRDEARRLVQRLAGHRPSAEDDRLVALFRNRAELKKELGALDDERHRLLDRLKLQEGATMRVEEQFATLEQYLGRAEEGYKCLAYFQLKGLWRAAAKRLELFATELTRQQKDRERRQQLADFDRAKRVRIADVDRELVEARVLADQLQAEQKLGTQRMNELGGFWNHFRRRKLSETLEMRALRLEAAQTVVTDLSDARHEVDSQAPPPFEGLGLEGRRAVNLAIIACAESLCDRLADGGLADLARQTTLRRVYESDYGSREECLALMERAARAAADLEKHTDDLTDIKARTDRLRRTVAYRGATDVIPTQDSVRPADAAGRAQATPNVLLEEYFEVYSVLLR